MTHRQGLIGLPIVILALTLLPDLAISQITGLRSPSEPPIHRIALIKSLLKERGYWITAVDTLKNAEYFSAIAAFRKLHRLPHVKWFSEDQLTRLQQSQRPIPLRTHLVYANGDTVRTHLEVDLERQVLFVVNADGFVTHILPVSSGNGKLFTTKNSDGTEWSRKAITPKGQYRITRRVQGWRKSEIGLLYYPLYYRGGVAVHGALVVPNVPASHGCIRIPMFAAPQLYSMAPVGHPIIVY